MMRDAPLKINFKLIASLEEISAQSWNRLCTSAYPFLRHEFLIALERNDCAVSANGWQAQHLLGFLPGESEPVVLMPLYLKSHSQGEYVFDHAWADAYYRNNMPYFPKLVSAIPFTPSAGPRIAVDEAVDKQVAVSAVVKFIIEHIEAQRLSSWHLLFSADEARLLDEAQSIRSGTPLKQEERNGQGDFLDAQHLLQRQDIQFHWINESFTSFDDYLSIFSSKKRKNIKRERRQVFESGIQLQRWAAQDLDTHQWQMFYQFYTATYLKRGRQPYLNLACFKDWASQFGDDMFLFLAEKDGELLAASLFFVGGDTLYGRYWGCLDDYHSLHFEACYYLGIEYCIQHGLKHFDAGAQGEHKVARGFVPIKTHSIHYIAHQGFREAIDAFILEENKYIDSYQAGVIAALPFKI